MMQHLLLWDNKKYSTTLSSAFGDNNVVANSDDFAIIAKQLDKYNSMIVLCELDWTINGTAINRQHLSGIEIVKELRREYDLKIPVLFVSFLSLADIFTPEREIITAIGHDFLRLPATPHDFMTFIIKEFSENGRIKDLSVMELNDIKSFYCSKEGILSHELHTLNHYLNHSISKENENKIVAKLENSIRKIHNLFTVESDKEVLKFQIKFKKLTQENINEAVKYIISIGDDLLKTYSEKTNFVAENENPKEKYSWKVLFLDDEINEQHELIQLMLKNKINVICVDNAYEAKRVLHEDWITENSITVVIADYRLYEIKGGVKHHQKIQGYQFLKEIAISDHLVRMVAFSGLQRKFLLNSFKHYNIRTEVKSKIDYLSSSQTQQFFCDEIIELAEENINAIEAMPSNSTSFKNTLETAYKMFRMHPDYSKMESNISLTAKEYVWEIKQQMENGEEIRIGAIDNIKSPLAQPKKDMEAFFKRFQNYLVARRIALWLQASYKKRGREIDNNMIAKILVDEKEYTPSACRAVINTNLGLSLADFPKSITIEERRWLQYDIKMKIFRDIQYVDTALLKMAVIFQEFLTNEKELQKNIVNGKLISIIEFQKQKINKISQERYDIYFDEKLLPKLRTPTDTRVLYQYILDNHQNQEGSEKYNQIILKLVSELRVVLLEINKNLPYQKKLFVYFNNEFRKFKKEKTVLHNPSAKVESKANFIEKKQSSLNKVYERVYELLFKNELPNEKDSADVWEVFCIGEDVIEKKRRAILEDNAIFYMALTKAINDENKLSRDIFNEGYGGKNLHNDSEKGGENNETEDYNDNEEDAESEDDDLY